MSNYRQIVGNILTADADVLTIPVNCKGVMGAGLARSFANYYPFVMPPYLTACRNGELRPGRPILLTITQHSMTFLLFPTKDHWSKPSQLDWVRDGLEYVLAETRPDKTGVPCWDVSTIAMPLLGCGLGGLHKKDVLPLIAAFAERADCNVDLYLPAARR